MHATDREVGFTELLGKPIDLPAGVAEHDGLCDGQTADSGRHRHIQLSAVIPRSLVRLKDDSRVV